MTISDPGAKRVMGEAGGSTDSLNEWSAQG